MPALLHFTTLILILKTNKSKISKDVGQIICGNNYYSNSSRESRAIEAEIMTVIAAIVSIVVETTTVIVEPAIATMERAKRQKPLP